MLRWKVVRFCHGVNYISLRCVRFCHGVNYISLRCVCFCHGVNYISLRCVRFCHGVNASGMLRRKVANVMTYYLHSLWRECKRHAMEQTSWRIIYTRECKRHAMEKSCSRREEHERNAIYGMRKSYDRLGYIAGTSRANVWERYGFYLLYNFSPQHNEIYSA